MLESQWYIILRITNLLVFPEGGGAFLIGFLEGGPYTTAQIPEAGAAEKRFHPSPTQDN